MSDLCEELAAAIDQYWSDQQLAVLLTRARDEIKRSRSINKRLDKIETLILRNGS